MSKLLKLLPVILSLGITATVLFYIYHSSQEGNTSANKAQESTGTIKNILFVPSHTEYRRIGPGNTGKRQAYTVPDMYYTTVRIDALKKDIVYESSVSPWRMYKTGDAVQVMFNKATTYTLTNGGIFIISIRKAKF